MLQPGVDGGHHDHHEVTGRHQQQSGEKKTARESKQYDRQKKTCAGADYKLSTIAEAREISDGYGAKERTDAGAGHEHAQAPFPRGQDVARKKWDENKKWNRQKTGEGSQHHQRGHHAVIENVVEALLEFVPELAFRRRFTLRVMDSGENKNHRQKTHAVEKEVSGCASVNISGEKSSHQAHGQAAQCGT